MLAHLKETGMTREEAIRKLASELANHHFHPVFQCSCILGVMGKLNVDWETHVAEISFEHAKGF